MISGSPSVNEVYAEGQRYLTGGRKLNNVLTRLVADLKEQTFARND